MHDEFYSFMFNRKTEKKIEKSSYDFGGHGYKITDICMDL